MGSIASMEPRISLKLRHLGGITRQHRCHLALVVHSIKDCSFNNIDRDRVQNGFLYNTAKPSSIVQYKVHLVQHCPRGTVKEELQPGCTLNESILCTYCAALCTLHFTCISRQALSHLVPPLPLQAGTLVDTLVDTLVNTGPLLP